MNTPFFLSLFGYQRLAQKKGRFFGEQYLDNIFLNLIGTDDPCSTVGACVLVCTEQNTNLNRFINFWSHFHEYG